MAGVQGDAIPYITTMKIDFVSNKYICEEYLLGRMSEGGAICFVSSATAAGWEKEDNRDCFQDFINARDWDETVKRIEDAGFTKLNPHYAYFSAKMALNNYAAKFQSVFGAKHIRVNVVLPGATATNFGSESRDAYFDGDKERLMKEFLSYVPYSQRIATAEEAAYPMIFLNSRYASYISGTMLYCDYGVTVEKDAGLRPYQNPSFKEMLTEVN